MIYSLKGNIVEIGKDFVCIDLGSIGYEVFVSRTGDFTLGEETLIFTHEVLTQDDHYLCGFKTKLEKDAFESLISVKGIGASIALKALSGTTPDELLKAISANNTAYLKKLPGIGPKAAAQIILDLKGKLVENSGKGDPKMYDEARSALKSLGFKVKEIDAALSGINEPGLTTQQVVSAALRKLKGK